MIQFRGKSRVHFVLQRRYSRSCHGSRPLLAICKPVIRDNRNAVACIVSSAEAARGQEALKVLIRTPTVARPDVIARLPNGAEGFAGLPVRVSLLDQTGARAKQYPTVVERELKNPVIDGSALPEKFISVMFPKDWLISGTIVHAERSVIATDGGRISSQTTCTITETDAAKWRQ